MKKIISNLTSNNTALIKNNFFNDSAHKFKDNDQNIWVNFATFATNLTLEFYKNNINELNIRDTLSFIGNLRFDFAANQQHQTEKGNNIFGIWRDANTGLNFQEIKNLVQKKHPKAPLEVTLYYNSFFKSHFHFEQIKENLELNMVLDPDSIRINNMDDRENGLLLDYLKQNKKFNVKPDSFYDIATFKKYSFIDMSYKDTEHFLTSFYFTANTIPYFFIADHPQPEFISALLNNKLNAIFSDCLNQDYSSIKKLTSTAELIWYCHQLMPFKRGTASILKILAASLLIQNGNSIKPYNGSRLDIDALSLSKKLFTKKFLENYS